jgi:hypothetical protein
MNTQRGGQLIEDMRLFSAQIEGIRAATTSTLVGTKSSSSPSSIGAADAAA